MNKCEIEHAKALLLKLNWLPPFLARITVGVVFAESGLGKLQNLERVIEFFAGLGIPSANFQAPMVATVEFTAGLLLMAGGATRLVSLPLIVIMTVAIVTAKAEEITSVSDVLGLSEFLYIILLLWLVVCGPGKIALDYLFCKKWRREK